MIYLYLIVMFVSMVADTPKFTDSVREHTKMLDDPEDIYSEILHMTFVWIFQGIVLYTAYRMIKGWLNNE